jgi:hypothetical protein
VEPASHPIKSGSNLMPRKRELSRNPDPKTPFPAIAFTLTVLI